MRLFLKNPKFPGEGDFQKIDLCDRAFCFYNSGDLRRGR
ncbi:hypothetical protein THTE_1979 [Thermogutta terrifontis]|uniref:Uncharacterized protein n=1 Tax=Thermogutta terrifontis TaxID=1331910 RepID=A0A286RF42_9BACT|nr:hypothetical protein THTE_1979 [Thermogutta terrifontis]